MTTDQNAPAPVEVGLLIIGDEILGGRRRDRHLEATIERVNARGMELAWAHYLGDDQAHLTAWLRATMATDALVFCCGGIGATPDDVTRQAAAAAAGVALERHPEGVAILTERFGEDASDTRLRMVDFPAGAQLIPNPVNRVPGFRLRRHCFLPGFPQMAWPMMEWALDTEFADLGGSPRTGRSVRVNARESDLVEMLEALGERHPRVRFSSLPEMRAGGGYVVELGVTGGEDAVPPAFDALLAWLEHAGVARVDG